MNQVQPATVYIVATPIGNMNDMTTRAIETLKNVDLIYAEDTRQTHKLLQYFGIKNTIYQLHKHNETVQKNHIAKALDSNQSIAIVSDAGTPLVADPGYLTTAHLRDLGHRLIVIPGCSAVVAALSISGLPADNFQFVGFAPSKSAQRQHFLAAFQHTKQSTVFFETPHRIKDCLQDCLDLFSGERKIFIGRELTKQFEETILLPLSAALVWLFEHEKRQKGEFVLILSPSTSEAETDWQKLVQLMLAESLPTKTITRLINHYTGESKKVIYQYVLEQTNNI
ncbi:MAG: 16S rRNA (cytidine(1402)-2'-O)-methyltransferase [Ostreibacterium sp.]